MWPVACEFRAPRSELEGGTTICACPVRRITGHDGKEEMEQCDDDDDDDDDDERGYSCDSRDANNAGDEGVTDK